MRGLVAEIAIGVFVVLLLGCAGPAKLVGHEPVVFADEQTGMAPSDEAFFKKVERHLDRQDRPGTTLTFR